VNWITRFINRPEPEIVFVSTAVPTAHELATRGAIALEEAGIDVTEGELRRLMVRAEMFVPSPTEPALYIDFWRSVFPAMALELIAERTTK
jgi:hypothetical protein